MGLAQPVLVWVVGDNTNVGKTTVSVALIRALNRLGYPTVGFKPYAGARLMDVLPLLEDRSDHAQALAGSDARRLLAASPCWPADRLEVLSPSWRLTHVGRDVGVFIRKGSDAIGVRYFRHTANATALWERPDFLQLQQSLHLPPTQEMANQDADRLDFEDQEVQKASFALIQAHRPAFVVCEGAGRLLPVWEGASPARHVLLVSGGALHFFAQVGLKVMSQTGGFGPFTVGAVGPQLAKIRHVKAPIPVAQPGALEGVMDRFIERFARLCLE